jgi:hypothetical protein
MSDDLLEPRKLAADAVEERRPGPVERALARKAGGLMPEQRHAEPLAKTIEPTRL